MATRGLDYHETNEEYVYPVKKELGNAEVQETLTTLISSLRDDAIPYTFKDLVGERTLADGGVVGGLLDLSKQHITQMVNDNELSEDIAGQVYSGMLPSAIDGALKFVMGLEETKQKNISLILDKLLKIYDLGLKDSTQEQQRYAIDNLLFERDRLNALKEEDMLESIEIKHRQHEEIVAQTNIHVYNLENTLPANTDNTTTKTELLDRDIDLKQHELDVTVPLKDDNIATTTVLLDKDIALKQHELVTTVPLKDDNIATTTDLLDRDIALKLHELNTTVPLQDDHLATTTDLLDRDIALKLHELNTTVPLKDDSIATSTVLLDKDIAIKEYTRTNVMPKEVLKTVAGTNLTDAETAIKALTLAEVMPLEILLLDKELSIKDYKYHIMMPQELAKLVADTNLVIKETELKDFTLNDLLPLDKEKSAEELALLEHKLLMEIYTLGTIMPTNVAKTVQETALVGRETSIKDYYNSYIQPKERDMTEAKAMFERYNAGWNGATFVNTESLPFVRIEQVKTQTELYERQNLWYDDQKYLDILKLQVNYRAMIFADETAPNPLNITADGNVGTVYGRLVT